MDWFAPAAREGTSTRVPEVVGRIPWASAQPRHSVTRANSDRLDLAVAAAVERLAESVLAGVAVAALYGAQDVLSVGAVLPGSSPSWLATDLDLLVHLVRLSAASGVVLPHGVAGAPQPDQAQPSGHLSASRECFREVADVLTRMSVAEEVTVECREEALRLLRQVERRARHLADGHPGAGDQGTRSVYDHGYFPGELLG
jgi:hypothetical protein